MKKYYLRDVQRFWVQANHTHTTAHSQYLNYARGSGKAERAEGTFLLEVRLSSVHTKTNIGVWFEYKVTKKPIYSNRRGYWLR